MVQLICISRKCGIVGGGGGGVALVYQPCVKFTRGQVGANMSESACGQLTYAHEYPYCMCTYVQDQLEDGDSESDIDTTNPNVDVDLSETANDALPIRGQALVSPWRKSIRELGPGA